MLKLWIADFLLPWGLGIYLMVLDRRTVLVIGVFTSVLAFLINTLGTYFGFWTLYPQPDAISTLPFDIGMFPVLATCMIFLIRRTSLNHIAWAFVFALGTSLLEQIAVWGGWVTFGRGWNIYWTFLSYLVPYLLVVWYARLMMVINKQDTFSP